MKFVIYRDDWRACVDSVCLTLKKYDRGISIYGSSIKGVETERRLEW